MSSLATELQRFLEFLTKQGRPPPTRTLRIVEIPEVAAVDQRGRVRVQRREVREPADYEARFEELMTAGFPWLNVSCYGVLDGASIVGIEVPGGPPRPSNRTSVNFSGPPAAVLNHGWSADEALAIE